MSPTASSAPQNLVLLWLTFPFLKAFHEFGHAFAVKVLGGEVHDMGIMFLVLTPIPYVDASAASAFRTKWERIIVGGAGHGRGDLHRRARPFPLDLCPAGPHARHPLQRDLYRRGLLAPL